MMMMGDKTKAYKTSTMNAPRKAVPEVEECEREVVDYLSTNAEPAGARQRIPHNQY